MKSEALAEQEFAAGDEALDGGARQDTGEAVAANDGAREAPRREELHGLGDGLGEDLGEDALGAALLACDGVDASALERWMGNPVVTNSDGGESDKIFDLTEGLDTSEVIALAPNLST